MDYLDIMDPSHELVYIYTINFIINLYLITSNYIKYLI
jgi:hypothetical protein